MIQRITGPLPFWTRREHPLLKKELAVTSSPKMRWLRLLLMVFITVAITFVSFAVHTNGFQQRAASTWIDAFHHIAYFPTLLLQVLAIIICVVSTVQIINEAIRGGIWESIRSTENGVGLLFRTRWASLFYKLRPILLILFAVRAVMILGLMVDLTSFNGDYLDLLISDMEPHMNVFVAILLIASLLTASMIQVFVNVGFESSLGLYIATLTRGTFYTSAAMWVWLILRVTGITVLVLAVTQYTSGSWVLDASSAWLLMLGFLFLGDWGLFLLSLTRFASFWLIVPYGIFIAPALLLAVVIQAYLSDKLLAAAARRAQMREGS